MIDKNTKLYYTEEHEAIKKKDFYVDRNDLDSIVKLVRAIDDPFYYEHTRIMEEDPYTGEKKLHHRAKGVFDSPVFCKPCSDRIGDPIQCAQVTPLGRDKPSLIICQRCETEYYHPKLI